MRRPDPLGRRRAAGQDRQGRDGHRHDRPDIRYQDVQGVEDVEAGRARLISGS